MDTIFVIVNLLVASFAFVAPWATIEAFDAGRLAGWMMTMATIVSHVYTWYAMSLNPEIRFCLGSAWAAYEFVCLWFAPLGVMEVEDKLAAAEAVANKG